MQLLVKLAVKSIIWGLSKYPSMWWCQKLLLSHGKSRLTKTVSRGTNFLLLVALKWRLIWCRANLCFKVWLQIFLCRRLRYLKYSTWQADTCKWSGRFQVNLFCLLSSEWSSLITSGRILKLLGSHHLRVKNFSQPLSQLNVQSSLRILWISDFVKIILLWNGK